MSILTDWTDVHNTKFQKEIMTFGHGLADTGLFTDAALIELLDKHPSEYLDVCSMSNDHPIYPNRFRTGDHRNVKGETLLAAAKAGRVWINVRKAMNLHPEYKKALDEMYGAIAEKTGNKAYNANGGILISSPISQTPYHFDKTEVILWHIRGGKRLYIYPATEEFISDESYEAVITDALMDDLPYKKDFDEAAQVFDLQPDQAITWPLNSPHRVDNTSFCVSVTTEYSTPQSGMKNAAMITNATLRHKLGLKPSYTKDGQALRYVKSVFGRVIKKAGMAVETTQPDMVTFKIDPKVEGFVVDTEPFERNF